ncbi:F-box protein PP2-B15-like isoform X2 [Prosopis cineraria]|uniref:F-box protein PP2-B15-like isoform X2 n=1 Tax=Prosopis cineraria TaxID=364024 RepID=UPI002410AEFD|nr:F-box protein PP2-B15-like isoform X2 [Prosopis cineraria]
MSNIDTLPEDCVSSILSFTSPADASRFCLVSSSLRSPALSDLLWLSFLPDDYNHIVSRALAPLLFSSKRDLFHALSHPILIDGGSKLDKSSAKKSYILSATELSLTRGNDPMAWSWILMPESRFSVVARLRTLSSLEIKCKIRTGILTPNTWYGAYLIVKVFQGAYGLDSAASEVFVEVGGVVKKGEAYLCEKDERKQKTEALFYGNRREMLERSSAVTKEDRKYPSRRPDGWTEIELGEFYSGEEDQEVKMSLREVGYQLKAGLVVEGIQLRPKHA